VISGANSQAAAHLAHWTGIPASNGYHPARPTELPAVSVIMPCLNERLHVSAALDSLLNNDYDSKRVEIVVVDGLSTDGTREILAEYAGKFPRVRLLDNPGASKSRALNLGIRTSSSDVIIRADCHCLYPADYVRKLVLGLYGTGVDNIGGVRHTAITGGRISQAVAISVSHPFTAGNAYYRIGTTSRRMVDTVFGGCYHREIFGWLGEFNEALDRTQDREFNSRLVQAGGRILLDPEIACEYYPRQTFWEHTRWTFEGAFSLFKFSLSESPAMIKWRNLAPLAFVLVQAVLLVLALSYHSIAVIVLLAAAVYIAMTVFVALRAAAGRGSPGLAPAICAVFGITHYAYGIGSVAGIAAGVGRRLKKPFGVSTRSAPRMVRPPVRAKLDTMPTVAVIVPCLNEFRYIRAFMENLLSSDYAPEKMLIVIVDGMSTDGTREILTEYLARDPRIRLLDNPRRITGAAVNIGIRESVSEVVVRLDVRAKYPPNYISHLVRVLIEQRADNVGAVRVTDGGHTAWSTAIASLVSHPFAAGDSEWRTGAGALKRAASVYCGCFRRQVFELVGLFDERVVRCEDREFNQRLQSAGGLILLDPSIRCVYTPRQHFLDYCRWTFRGALHLFYWSLETRTPMLRWRNFIPLSFLLYHAVPILLRGTQWFGVSLLPLVAYWALNIIFATSEARRSRCWKVAPLLVGGFYVTHMLYGAGSITGTAYYLYDGFRRLLRRLVPGGQY